MLGNCVAQLVGESIVEGKLERYKFEASVVKSVRPRLREA